MEIDKKYMAFLNRKVKMFHEIIEKTHNGEIFQEHKYSISDDDIVIEELEEVIAVGKVNNPEIKFRIICPNSIITRDYKQDRINFYIGKDGVIHTIKIG